MERRRVGTVTDRPTTVSPFRKTYSSTLILILLHIFILIPLFRTVLLRIHLETNSGETEGSSTAPEVRWRDSGPGFSVPFYVLEFLPLCRRKFVGDNWDTPLFVSCFTPS